MWYLGGVGSNIRPETNLAIAIDRLLADYGSLWLSPVISTFPEGIDTERSFLNALVIVFSPQSPQHLKSSFNHLEETLVRDRSDPLSSRKDRTIDIDILEHSDNGFFSGEQIGERYYRNLFNDRFDASFLSTITVRGHSLGKTPTTIYRNLCASDEIVVQQGQQLNNHGVKSTLAGQ